MKEVTAQMVLDALDLGSKMFTVKSDDTLSDAITKLVEERVGCTVVMDDDDEVVGMVTAR